MKNEQMIIVENLSKTYSRGEKQAYFTLRDSLVSLGMKLKNIGKKKTNKNKFLALKNISFSVKKGEVIGIIGKNGAGKSTLLKVLSRITPPSKGSFTVNGRVSSLLEVGTGFHPELTGRENIYLNGAILGMSRAEIKAKYKDIVDFAEIGKFIDTPVKRYSSGMGVRLAFAVAAHLEPEILLIDEVLAVGDVAFQKKCLGKMQDVANQYGRTIIFVSHNLNAIRSLCTRVVVLKNGKIAFEGSPQKAISAYMSEIETINLEKKWSKKNRPGNKSISIESIRLVDKNHKKLGEITTDTNFLIEINYQVKKPTSTGFTILVDDNQNNEIFSSINNHEKNWYGRVMKQGKYKTYCHVPGKLMNNGRFYLSLIMFGSNYSDPQLIDNILSIDIADGSEIRGDFYGEFGGVFRPRLAWDTIKQ